MTQLDLNLLKVLRVLLDVKNTRKAAYQLGISQPAVSRSLGRLREHFSDELFIRCAYGLEPTSKAEEIGLHLPAIMDQLSEVVAGNSEFFPQDFHGRFTIAINGFISQWIAPQLISLLSQKAPNAELNILNWENSTPELILDGSVDLGINYFPQQLSKQLVQNKIARDEFIFICRTGHPIDTNILEPHHFERYPLAQHVIPNWNDNANITVQTLKLFNINAKVQLRSNQLNTILQAIQSTDMLFPCSKFSANLLGDEYRQLKIASIFPTPSSDIALIVANKRRRHPLNLWFQNEVTQSITSVTSSRLAASSAINT